MKSFVTALALFTLAGTATAGPSFSRPPRVVDAHGVVVGTAVTLSSNLIDYGSATIVRRDVASSRGGADASLASSPTRKPPCRRRHAPRAGLKFSIGGFRCADFALLLD